MRCEHCGGELVPGIPGDVYCPEPECFERDMRAAKQLVREWREREERAELARLKAKYE